MQEIHKCKVDFLTVGLWLYKWTVSISETAMRGVRVALLNRFGELLLNVNLSPHYFVFFIIITAGSWSTAVSFISKQQQQRQRE